MALPYCGTARLSTDDGAAALLAATIIMPKATARIQINPKKNRVNVFVKYLGFTP
jgi:hypothetical protein